jgi:uncharacterized RDD family membrane protein YckC
MTDPAGGAPAPQGQGNWQTPPPPAPGGFQPGNFQPGNFQPAAVAAGPAPGVVYADIVTRIIALVIDSIILFVPYIVVATILIFLPGIIGWLLPAIIYIAWSGGYFVYTWTKMRASYGQKFMKLETVSAADGSTLTQERAIRRWAFLYGPQAIATVFSYGGGLYIGMLGSLISLLALGYAIYLLYTTSQSPKRQGFHDVQAGTVVVKRLA